MLARLNRYWFIGFFGVVWGSLGGLMLFILWGNESRSRPVVLSVSSVGSREVVKEEYLPQEVLLGENSPGDHGWVATLSAERVRTLVSVGDVMLGRSVNYKAWERNDWGWVFVGTAELLREADLSVGNLESPLVTDCALTNEGMKFCGDIRWVEGLSASGFDVMTMANNHANNYGGGGIDETASLLEKNGIGVFGVGDVMIRDVRGIKFGFLGYNDVGVYGNIARAEKELIESQVKLAKKGVDVVVVYFHWGEEYTQRPSLRQRELAKLSIDAGADLVLGSHPHWIQPVEVYKEGLIVYSHGNFVFDQMWSMETREGIVGKYSFYDDRLIDAEFVPILIEDYGRPRFIEEE